MNKVRNILTAFLLIFSITHKAYADFGESCTGVTFTGDIHYLNNYTIYGYLAKMIDMTTYTAGAQCNDNLPQIVICIKNNNNTSNPPCDLVTFLPDGSSKKLRDFSTNTTLLSDPHVQNITFQAQYMGSNLCITMPTPYGYTPIVCKRMTQTTSHQTTSDTSTCTPVAAACFGTKASQSPFNFSGRAIQCLQETFHEIFFEPVQCPGSTSVNLEKLRAFAVFGESLKTSIRAFLILYVMGFGMNILLKPESVSLESISSFLIKFFLVTYFSVGLGPVYFSNGTPTTHNGMVEWGLPILTSLTNDLAEIVFSAGGVRGMCDFDITKYPAGKGYYALWDKIDCKLGSYFGEKTLYNVGINLGNFVELSVPQIDSTDPVNMGVDTSATGAFGMLTVVWGIIAAAQIVFFIFLLIILAILFGVFTGFISVYVVCVVSLYVLIYISPIFIPMALFKRTKPYFDSWLKLCLSCALQPAVIAGFIALIITLYDDLAFGGCKFQRHDYTDNTRYYSTFEMRLPSGDHSSCEMTFGFKALSYTLGFGWESHGLLLFSWSYLKDVGNMFGDAMMIVVFSVLFYYFLDSLYSFSSDLTGGILSLSGVAVSPKQMADKALDKMVSVAKFAAKAASRGQSSKAEKASGGDDKGGSDGDKGGPPRPSVPSE